MIHCLPETVVTEVGSIQDHTQPFHFLQKIFSLRAQAAGGVRSLRVSPGTIMRRTYSTQTISVSSFQVLYRHQRIRAFEAEYITNGFLFIAFSILPALQMLFKRFQVVYLHHLPCCFHGAVPG